MAADPLTDELKDLKKLEKGQISRIHFFLTFFKFKKKRSVLRKKDICGGKKVVKIYMALEVKQNLL